MGLTNLVMSQTIFNSYMHFKTLQKKGFAAIQNKIVKPIQTCFAALQCTLSSLSFPSFFLWIGWAAYVF